MTTAFVLTGGGSLGAVQVGMLQALAARRIEPDLLVGTSAGAINASWVATHGMSEESLAGLADVWVSTRRSDVFPADLRQMARGLLGASGGIVPAARLASVVAGCAGEDDLSRTRIPTHIVAADLMSGEDMLISSGPLVTAVLASAAVPGIFPPVRHEGRLLVDGAISAHAGLTQAIRLGATRIFLLPAGSACALRRPPTSAVAVALHALTLLLQQRLAQEFETVRDAAEVKVLPPLCPLAVSAGDFGHAAHLIDRAHRSSTRWITSGAIDRPFPAEWLRPHRDRRPAATTTDAVAGA